MVKKYILGLDEVGTGSAVAHFTVAAALAEANWKISGLKDSKKLSPKQRLEIREKLFEEVKLGNIQYVLVERSNEQIDSMGFSAALKSAYVEAVKTLYNNNVHIIIDGNTDFLKDLDYDYELLIKADNIIPSVQAAAILAKTTRDAQIDELAKLYPEYGWQTSKGYLTKEHKAAIKKFGLTKLHRASYNIKY